ncbi:MAG: hypothetical protein KAX76_02975, partial [Comamonas sp.]|nr:hypothetical protein [Comamonas sp.]
PVPEKSRSLNCASKRAQHKLWLCKTQCTSLDAAFCLVVAGAMVFAVLPITILRAAVWRFSSTLV